MASVRKVNWTYKGVTKSAWQVTYTDPATGKRPSKNFKMKKEADAFRLHVEKEIEAGVHTARSRSKTVEEACEAFIRYTEDRMKDGRIGRVRYDQIKRTLTRDTIPFLGKVLVSDLTATMIEDLYSKLLKQRKISPYILRTHIVVIKQMEDFALRREWTKKSAVTQALKELRGLEKPPQRKFSPEQVLCLLRHAKAGRFRMSKRGRLLGEVIVNVAAFCGLRYGEIMALKEENILFGEGVIRVRHNLTERDLLKGPKTKAGNRDVPMPVHVADLLREWIRLFRLPEPRGLIFRTKGGKAFSAGHWHLNSWHPLLKAAGLSDGSTTGARADHLHFHGLRGFAASWWIDNGVPVTTVAKWLGHSKPDMTLEFYARSMVSNVEQRETADRLATRLLAGQRVLIPATTAREFELSA